MERWIKPPQHWRLGVCSLVAGMQDGEPESLEGENAKKKSHPYGYARRAGRYSHDDSGDCSRASASSSCRRARATATASNATFPCTFASDRSDDTGRISGARGAVEECGGEDCRRTGDRERHARI